MAAATRAVRAFVPDLKDESTANAWRQHAARLNIESDGQAVVCDGVIVEAVGDVIPSLTLSCKSAWWRTRKIHLVFLASQACEAIITLGSNSLGSNSVSFHIPAPTSGGWTESVAEVAVDASHEHAYEEKIKVDVIRGSGSPAFGILLRRSSSTTPASGLQIAALNETPFPVLLYIAAVRSLWFGIAVIVTGFFSLPKAAWLNAVFALLASMVSYLAVDWKFGAQLQRVEHGLYRSMANMLPRVAFAIAVTAVVGWTALILTVYIERYRYAALITDALERPVITLSNAIKAICVNGLRPEAKLLANHELNRYRTDEKKFRERAGQIADDPEVVACATSRPTWIQRFVNDTVQPIDDPIYWYLGVALDAERAGEDVRRRSMLALLARAKRNEKLADLVRWSIELELASLIPVNATASMSAAKDRLLGVVEAIDLKEGFDTSHFYQEALDRLAQYEFEASHFDSSIEAFSKLLHGRQQAVGKNRVKWERPPEKLFLFALAKANILQDKVPASDRLAAEAFKNYLGVKAFSGGFKKLAARYPEYMAGTFEKVEAKWREGTMQELADRERLSKYVSQLSEINWRYPR